MCNRDVIFAGGGDPYRRRMRFAAVVLSLVTFAAACSSDDASDGDPAGDAGPLGADPLTCMGGAYDTCASNEDCESGNCHEFRQEGIKVCVTACTPNDSNTCHTQNGEEIRCNTMGICRPTVANTCP